MTPLDWLDWEDFPPGAQELAKEAPVLEPSPPPRKPEEPAGMAQPRWGAILDRLRAAGLSSRQLASRAGVARKTVGRIARGRPCKRATLKRLAEVLECREIELMEPDPPPR